MERSETSNGGIGFVGVLTLIFITLKLLGKLEWSWWWVLSPIWISSCVVMVFLLVFLAWKFWREVKKL